MRWPIDSVPGEQVADAICEFTVEDNAQDNCLVVIAHRQEATTRLMPPIIVASPLLGRSGVNELLVGSPRLGNQRDFSNAAKCRELRHVAYGSGDELRWDCDGEST